MSAAEALQIGAFLLIVVLLVKPFGAYLERVFERRPTFLDSLLLPVERRFSSAD
jgi:K+-transporting ATPase A subunit